MIIVRLVHWMFRMKVIRNWIAECTRCGLKRGPKTIWIPHDQCPSCGCYIKETYRVPTFKEAVTGISN